MTDDDALNGITSGPLTEPELRALRKLLYDERQMDWLKRVGWKWFLGLVAVLSAIAGAFQYFLAHFHYKP